MFNQEYFSNRYYGTCYEPYPVCPIPDTPSAYPDTPKIKKLPPKSNCVVFSEEKFSVGALVPQITCQQLPTEPPVLAKITQRPVVEPLTAICSHNTLFKKTNVMKNSNPVIAKPEEQPLATQEIMNWAPVQKKEEMPKPATHLYVRFPDVPAAYPDTPKIKPKPAQPKCSWKFNSGALIPVITCKQLDNNLMMSNTN